MSTDSMAATVQQIAAELTEVRKRGVDRLDIDTRQQPYRKLPVRVRPHVSVGVRPGV